MPTPDSPPSLAQFSLIAWRDTIEIETVQAISLAASETLGSAVWEQGRAALAKALEMAETLRGQIQEAKNAAEERWERQRKEFQLQQALVSARKDEAQNRPSNMILMDDAPDAKMPNGSADAFADHKLSHIEEILRRKSIFTALGLGGLDDADRAAGLAVLREAKRALRNPSVVSRLGAAAFTPLSPSLALLPVLGLAAVAKPVSPGGEIALRAGSAPGVLADESDIGGTARALRTTDARFGFAPGIDAAAGSFDQPWHGFSRGPEFTSHNENNAIGKLSAKALARALNIDESGLQSLFEALGSISLSVSEPRNAILPERFETQALAAVSGRNWRRKTTNLGDLFGTQSSIPGIIPLATWALRAVEALSVGNGLELPSLMSHPELRDEIPAALSDWFDEGGRSPFFRPNPGREFLRKKTQTPLEIAANALGAHQAFFAQAFSAMDALKNGSQIGDQSFNDHSETVRRAAASASEQLNSWIQRSGVGSAKALASRVFSSQTLSVSQISRVARSPAAFSQALDECGVHGRLAVGLSEFLELSPAGLSSGNALCALARDAWTQRGGSAAGWRLMGQLPAPLVTLFLSAVQQPGSAQTSSGRDDSEKAFSNTLNLAECCVRAHLSVGQFSTALALRHEWAPQPNLSVDAPFGAHAQRTHHALLDGAQPGRVLVRPLTVARKRPTSGFSILDDLPGAPPDVRANWSGDESADSRPVWLRESTQKTRNILSVLADPLEWRAPAADAQQAAARFAEEQAKEQRAPFVLRDLIDRVIAKDILRPGFLDGARAIYLAEEASPKERAEAAEHAFHDQIQDVIDFLRDSEPGVWQSFPAKPQWPLLVRRAKEWHELVLLREDEARGAKEWAPLFGEQADGEFKAVELTNGAQLHAEGQRMHHCVSTYADRCANGHCRIFSIEKNSEPHSTLELAWANDQWSAGQNLGYCNTRHIDAKAAQLGQKLAEKANGLGLRPQTTEEAAALAATNADSSQIDSEAPTLGGLEELNARRAARETLAGERRPQDVNDIGPSSRQEPARARPDA